MRFKNFLRKLTLPKTGVYILLGVIIMFLTFLTTDNAMEIAISGIASIFIGIGVNNFTEAETHDKEVAVRLKKISIAIKTLQHTQEKLNNTCLLFEENISTAALKTQLKEMENFVELSLEQLMLISPSVSAA